MKDSVAASEVHALVRQTLPFFYSNAPRYFTAISDHDLALLMPVLVYWSASLFFHALDVLRRAWSEKFRLHEPEELNRRNLSLIHISETTRREWLSRMPSSA